MNAGNIIFNFKGDTKDIEKKTSNIGNTVKSLASGFLKSTAIIGTALAGVTAKAVSMAGDIEQQIGGTEAVFKDFASEVQDKSKRAFSTMGVSANDYMATINKMGSLMQGSGIDIKTSMELSSKAMQRASDVASIMGIDISSAMESIAGAAKGNFTMMDNLGVAMNATTIEAYALEKGIKQSYATMDNATKIQLAMEMFLEKSAYAMGNYSKENETFAGSLSTVKAAVSNLIAGVGNLDEVIDSVQNFGKILVKSITTVAPKVVDGIVGLVNGIIPMIPDLINQLLPPIINGVVALFQGIVDALPTLLNMLAGMLPTILTSLMNGTIQIANSLTEMLPSLLPQIVDAILGLIPMILDNLPLMIDTGIDLIMALVDGIVASIPILMDHAPEIIEKLLLALGQSLPKLMSIGYLIPLRIIDGMLKNAPQMWKKLPELLQAMYNGAIGFIKNFNRIGTNIVNGIIDGIKSKISSAVDSVKNLASKMLGGIKSKLGIHSPSREFKYIGNMTIEGFDEGIEDREDELQRTFDSMFDLSPSLYGNSSLNMSPNVEITVNNNMKQDSLGQLVNDIKTFAGGSKNDYNYGGE